MAPTPPPPPSSSRSYSRSPSSSTSSSSRRHASLATTTTTTTTSTRITKRSSTRSLRLTRHKALTSNKPTPSKTTPNKTTPSTPSTAWSDPADALLTRLRASNVSWNDIAKHHFPTKSSNACRKHHERVKLREKAASFDEGEQKEWLAREYMAVREEMWSLLAERMETSEDGGRGKEAGWEVVERKCLEMGLRGLRKEAKGREKGEKGETTTKAEEDGQGGEGDAAFEEVEAEFEERDAEDGEQDSSEAAGSLHDSGIELQDEVDVPANSIKKEAIAPELPQAATPISPLRGYGYLQNQPRLHIESPAPSANYVLEPVVRRTETPLRTPSRKITIGSLLRSPSPSPEAVPRVERWRVA